MVDPPGVLLDRFEPGTGAPVTARMSVRASAQREGDEKIDDTEEVRPMLKKFE